MSVALRFVRGLEGRARTRMAWPRALNAAAIAEPRKPLAPVTRMVEGGAEWNALHVARPADPRSCETTPCPLSRSISRFTKLPARSQGRDHTYDELSFRPNGPSSRWKSL